MTTLFRRWRLRVRLRMVAPDLLLGALVVAFALRLLLLGSKSLWLDEAQSVTVAMIGQQALWAGALEKHHPPLYYWLLQQWMVWGNNEFVLRLPSAVFGAATIPLIYQLAKDLCKRQAALTAVWLAALSPLLIWYSQEVRSYTLVTFLLLVATVAATRLFLSLNPGWWLLFVGATTAALYTHYIALLFMVVQLLIWIFLFIKRWSGQTAVLTWLVGWVAAFLFYTPWLAMPVAQDFFLDLWVSDRFYVAQIVQDRLNIPFPYVLLLAGSVVAIISLAVFFYSYQLFQRYNRIWLWWRTQPGVRVGSVTLFAFLLAIIVIPWGYTLKRQLVVFWPLVLLIFAWFWPWRRSNRTLLGVVFSLSLLASLANVVWVPKDQWRETALFVSGYSQPQDVVFLVPGYMNVPFNYYNQGQMASQRIFNGPLSPQLEPLLDEYSRIWFVAHRRDDPAASQAVETWLRQHATRVQRTNLYNIQIQLYQRE